MTKLLIRLFVKDYENTKNETVRNRYGMLSGFVGIVLNIILSAFKMIFGSLTGSISITADGVNNLFDAASSVISLVGFKISGKPADKDHPFGHGRIEYVSALSLAFLVLITGVELIKSSVSRFKAPEAVVFGWPAFIVLVLTILGKIWLAYFNSNVGKRINSLTVDAVVKDSLGDIIATTATLIALVSSKFTALPVDSVMGIAVALFVIYSGISIIKDTMGPLLGEPPDKEIVEKMEKLVLSHEGILGIHDLVVHTYGHAKIFASLHAEVPADVDVMLSHDLIDNIEKDIFEELGIEASIHLDPIDVNDERIGHYKAIILEVLSEIDESITIHDFRIVDGPTHTNLIFDAVIPFGVKTPRSEIKKQIDDNLHQKSHRCFTVINFDESYV